MKIPNYLPRAFLNMRASLILGAAGNITIFCCPSNSFCRAGSLAVLITISRTDSMQYQPTMIKSARLLRSGISMYGSTRMDTLLVNTHISARTRAKLAAGTRFPPKDMFWSITMFHDNNNHLAIIASIACNWNQWLRTTDPTMRYPHGRTRSEVLVLTLCMHLHFFCIVAPYHSGCVTGRRMWVLCTAYNTSGS